MLPPPTLLGNDVGGSFMKFLQTGRYSVVLNDRIRTMNISVDWNKGLNLI